MQSSSAISMLADIFKFTRAERLGITVQTQSDNSGRKQAAHSMIRIMRRAWVLSWSRDATTPIPPPQFQFSKKYNSAPLSNGHPFQNVPRSSCSPQSACQPLAWILGELVMVGRRNEEHPSCMALYRFVLLEKIALGTVLLPRRGHLGI